MKLIIKVFLFSLLFFNYLYAHLEFTPQEKKYIHEHSQVKIAMLPDFPPFSTYENGKLNGFSYDILELISKKSGLEFIYEIDTWPENLKKFKSKEVDMIDSISFKKDRLAFTNFTDPYYEVPLVIFSRKDINNYTDLESLKGKKLGNTKNIFYKKQIEDLNIFEIKEYESFDEKLRALAFGEVDVILGHLLSTQRAIKKSKYTNMKVLGELNLPNLKKTDLRLGIEKENKLLTSIIRKSFAEISREEMSDLHQKWLSIYTTKKDKIDYNIVNLSKKERAFLIKNDIKCVLSPNWAPFYFLDGKEMVGLSIGFWNLIQDKTLIRSTCEVADSFDEVLELIKNKKADITISTAITENKKKFARFSIPYISFPIAIATTMDKRYIQDISSLNNKKVAVGKSYSAYYILKEKYPKIKFVEVHDNYEALQLLSNGDVDAVVDILPVLSHFISSYGFKNIKISGITKFNFDVRFMVRKDYQTLIPIINRGINHISKQELNEIKNKWLSVKLEKIVDYSRVWQIIFLAVVILSILFYRQHILNKHNKKLQEAKDEVEEKREELQKRTKQLIKQKKLFEKIFNDSTDGIYLLSLNDSKIIDCNDSCFKMLEYDSKDNLLELGLIDFFPKRQPNGVDSILQMEKKINVAIKDGFSSFELVHKTKDEKNIWFEVVLTPLTIDDKEIIHIVLRNINDRKLMEEKLNILTHNLEGKVKEEVRKNEEKTKQLLQQSRLAQMGEMLSMIAHQWRQPLTAISATTNNLIIRIMLNEKIDIKEFEKEITLISDYSQHLSLTIDDFRNFFKPNKDKVDITIEKIIANSINIVKKSLESRGIALLEEFSCNETINVFASEVNQVILNLIKNAEDAIIENNIENGKITIKTFTSDNKCIVEISDNAKGIDESIIDNIFDPYFSTKKEKEGSGLGLYMSRIIINDHTKGNITVSNNEEGAVFKIEIPLKNFTL